MNVKKDELSLQELNELLFDLGIGETAPKKTIQPSLGKSLPSKLNLPLPKNTYLSKKRNLLIPISMIAIFLIGFFGGILFASSLSLMKRAIHLEEKIMQRLDQLDSAFLAPQELKEERSEIIEPLPQKKNGEALPKEKV